MAALEPKHKRKTLMPSNMCSNQKNFNDIIYKMLWPHVPIPLKNIQMKYMSYLFVICIYCTAPLC
jgi:hypothetical protein